MYTHELHAYCRGVKASRLAETEIVSELYMDVVYPIDHGDAYRITLNRTRIPRTTTNCISSVGTFRVIFFWYQLGLHGSLTEFLHTKCSWQAHTQQRQKIRTVIK